MRIELDRPPAEGPAVWALGGGKGGVGKSVIALNTAVALAHFGHKVVLVDADLGGANLHTLFGMPNPRPTLSDFFARRVPDLESVMNPTPVDDLWLISGSRALLEMANPKYAVKEKVLRHIAALEVDHVLLDLGAGSAFNVLDFFLSARRGILVVVPEHTSVENAYHFLKAAYYRKLKRAEPRDQVRRAIETVMAERARRGVHSPKDLVEQVLAVDPEAGAALTAEAATFRPAIVVNRAQRPDHHRLGDEMSLACRDYFGTAITALSCIENDLLVPHSIEARRPIVELHPESPFSVGIDRLARRIAGLREETGV